MLLPLPGEEVMFSLCWLFVGWLDDLSVSWIAQNLSIYVHEILEEVGLGLATSMNLIDF